MEGPARVQSSIAARHARDASLAGGRAIASLVVGVSPYDPAVYTAIVATTIVLAVAASALAARRAAAVDPVELMRAE